MGRDEEWRKALTTGIEARIRDTRKAQKITVEQLSERTRDLGFEIPRSTITNIESMRKAHVAVHEVVILAAALNVPPVTLLFDYADGSAVEVLPDVERTGIEAVEWFAGNWPMLPLEGLRTLPSISPYEGAAFEHNVEKWAEVPETAQLLSLRRFEQALEQYHGAAAFRARVEQDLEDVEAGRPPRFGAVSASRAPRTVDEYRDEVEIAEQREALRLIDARRALTVARATGAHPPYLDAEIRRDAAQATSKDELHEQIDRAMKANTDGGDDGTPTA